MLRLIREFMIALQKMLEKKEIESKQETLKKLYQQFVGDATFYRLEPIEEILKALREMPEDERLGKTEMLAELYYHEGLLSNVCQRHFFYSKAMHHYTLIETQTKTFSAERQAKMQKLQQALNA